jgi:RHS repeat-associated protein
VEKEIFITCCSNQQRVKTLYIEDGIDVKTKYKALGKYEKDTDSTGDVRELYYISGADGEVAVLQRMNEQDSIFYIHKDHPGSFDVISNPDGTVKERYNYDPCLSAIASAKAEGRRRNPSDWSYDNVSSSFYIDRGFSGHEHRDQLGLINMLSEAKSRSLQASGNGRVYDPVMAMFLSPDNFVQSPDLTQNLNRYTYCLNNPLSYLDPSGNTYLQYMQQHYEQFDYRGGYYSKGTYYQATFGGGYSPTANTSYDALNPEYEYHYDSYLGKYQSDLTGEVVEWEEVFISEVLPSALAVIDFNELRQNLNNEWQKSLTASVGWPNDAPGGWGVNFQGDSKVTVGVQAGGDIGGLGGKYGVFVNLCSITLIGHEGTKLIYPGSQSGGMTQINQGITGGLGLGAGVSHTFDGSFEGGGYSNGTYSFDGGLDKGIFSIKYNSTPEGETLDIGFSIHIGLILGFEGNYKIRIKW